MLHHVIRCDTPGCETIDTWAFGSLDETIGDAIHALRSRGWLASLTEPARCPMCAQTMEPLQPAASCEISQLAVLSPDTAERLMRQKWGGKDWRVHGCRLTVDHLVAVYRAIYAGDTRVNRLVRGVPFGLHGRACQLLREAGYIHHTVGIGWRPGGRDVVATPQPSAGDR